MEGLFCPLRHQAHYDVNQHQSSLGHEVFMHLFKSKTNICFGTRYATKIDVVLNDLFY